MARLSSAAASIKAPARDLQDAGKKAHRGEAAATADHAGVKTKEKKNAVVVSRSNSSSKKKMSMEKANKRPGAGHSTSPAVRLVDLRANTALRMASARARLSERMVCAGASMRVAMIRLRHPVHPVHRVAATEAAHETRAAAMQRREQRIAKARIAASQKKALARERRARELKHSVATI